MTDVAVLPSAEAVVAELHRARRASDRQRRPLLDRLFPLYLAAILSPILIVEVGGLDDLHIGATPLAKSAAGHALVGAVGSIWIAVALLVLATAAMGGIDGGPAALSGGETVLLTWPVSRRRIVQRCLSRAWFKSLVGGLVLGGFVVLALVSGFKLPLGHAVLSSLLLPPVLATAAVSVGFIVQTLPSIHSAIRAAGSVIVGLELVAAGLLYRSAGATAAWHRLARVGRVEPWRLLTRAGQPGPILGSQLIGLAIIVAIGAVVMALAWHRAVAIEPEELVRRSNRAQSIGAALFLGDASTIYLTRRQSTRARRTRRWDPPIPGRWGGLIGKGAVQQQGVPIIGRILGAAIFTMALAAITHSGSSTPSGKLDAVFAGLGVSLLGGRYIDPVRLDLEQPSSILGIPVPYWMVGFADLLAPWVLLLLGAAIGVPMAVALHITTIKVGGTVFLIGAFAGLVSISAAAITAITTRNIAAAVGADAYVYRLSGALAAAVVLGIGASFAHKREAAGVAALIVLAIALAIVAASAFGDQLRSG